MTRCGRAAYQTPPMAYCHRCGRFADLDAAAMCADCRDSWHPAAPGYRTQPQPSGGTH